MSADWALQAVEVALAARSSAEVDASADRHQLALTRFANSVIHQNVAEDGTTVRVRIHDEGRTATASATVTDEDGVRRLVERALASVQVAPLDPLWPGVATPAAAPESPSVDPAVADVPPAARAEVVRGFVDGAAGLETAGYVRTSHWNGSFATSAGQRLAGEATESGLAAIARSSDGADGVARAAPLALGEIDGAALGARAAAKAMAQNDPVELPPGRYEVVLEPTAVADILESLAGAGFNGQFVNEGRSFVRLGEQQFDPSLTLVDDPLAVGLNYDDDGTPRQLLTLVEDGTVVSLTYDRRSAAEFGATSTGHGVEGRFSWGPAARHLGVLPTGGDAVASEVDGPMADSSVAELVAGVERGVLVTDFWYTRMLDPRSLAITGLTRNGIWLIEGGRVTTPLRNFRFTQSYAQARMPGNVLGIGRTAMPVPGDTYTATTPRWSCPALHLASWNFTGGASG